MADTLDLINCPACGKKMTKIYLKEQGFNIDICLDGCGGIYLDNREFKKVDEQKEDITPVLEAIKNKTFEKTDEEKTRICPVCGHDMVKNYASVLKKIEIDECYNCGGKFFDHNELLAIRNEFTNEEERIKAFNDYANKKFKGATDGLSSISSKKLGKVINIVSKYI